MKRLQQVQVAHNRWAHTWRTAIGPHHGPCLCGDPDARHRVADAMVSRYQAGDDLLLIASDYADHVPVTHDYLYAVAELVGAGLAYEIARRRARLPRSHRPDP